MDKLSKAIKKLTKKDAEKVTNVIELLMGGDSESLDIKKLKRFTDIFRVRTGQIRVIFRKQKDEIFILSIGKRDDSPYREY